MALANEKLKQEMITRPASEFDIESVDEAQPYIKMVLFPPRHLGAMPKHYL